MKKVLLFVGLPLVLIVTAVALGVTGIVNIPGISPPNFGKKVLASKDPAGSFLFTLCKAVEGASKVIEDQTKADAAKAAIAAKPVVDKPKPDLDKGDDALAEVWNDIEPASLATITTKWKPQDLARVLLKMDTDKVSKFIGGLPAPRAEELSRAIQTLAAQPPPAAAASL